MELPEHQIYQGGPFNMEYTPYQFGYQDTFDERAYGVQEGRQHLDSTLDLQQISQPWIMPKPQTPSLLSYPNDVDRIWYDLDGMHFENFGEAMNDHSHQQRQPHETEHKASSGTPGKVQGQGSAAHHSSPGGLLNGDRGNEKKLSISQHGEPPPIAPATSSRVYGSFGGSHDGRPRKAHRIDIACVSCRMSKTKCSGGRPRCFNCNGRNLTCVYEDMTPEKFNQTGQFLIKIDVRTQEMERMLQRLISNSPREVTEEPHQTTAISQDPAVWKSHRTAASSILSYDFVRKVIDNVVHDDQDAMTIRKETDLYMKNVNILYPLLTLTQLESLIRDFITSNSISNTTPEHSAGLKRKQPGSELLQSSIERALVFLIRALGKKYDNSLSPTGEGSPTGSTMFGNGYPTPKHVEKTLISTALDEHSSYETRITGVTPGLDYFDAAKDIMAEHISGNSLCHVQVYLLASIYHGQQAQDSQRHHYLLEAARALQFFLQSKRRQFESTEWDSTVISIFWTQRILESELVAERALPESGLHAWEQIVPLPDIPNTNALMIQIQLRQHLRAIGTDLYQHGFLENLEDEVALSSLYATVERLYRRVGEIYKPHPVEADDLNPELTMRLNAKAIAAIALIFRPCLIILLNRKDSGSSISFLACDYARRCIRAFFYSIQSSNLIKDDSLTTHGQWANVMMLLAASADFALKHLIKHDLLKVLVSQTHESLSIWPSSELEQKCVKVLKDMALRTGLYHDSQLLLILPSPIHTTNVISRHSVNQEKPTQSPKTRDNSRRLGQRKYTSNLRTGVKSLSTWTPFEVFQGQYKLWDAGSGKMISVSLPPGVPRPSKNKRTPKRAGVDDTVAIAKSIIENLVRVYHFAAPGTLLNKGDMTEIASYLEPIWLFVGGQKTARSIARRFNMRFNTRINTRGEVMMQSHTEDFDISQLCKNLLSTAYGNAVDLEGSNRAEAITSAYVKAYNDNIHLDITARRILINEAIIVAKKVNPPDPSAVPLYYLFGAPHRQSAISCKQLRLHIPDHIEDSTPFNDLPTIVHRHRQSQMHAGGVRDNLIREHTSSDEQEESLG